MSLPLSSRLFDAADVETVVHRVLAALAREGRWRQVAYAEFDAELGTLTRRWCLVPGGALEEATLSLEPHRLHPLLNEDALDKRPLRPVDNAPAWALRDLLPAYDPQKANVRVRAISDRGRWLGVLAVAIPRLALGRQNIAAIEGAGDVLELALGRLIADAEREETARLRQLPGDLDELARAERVERLEHELRETRASLDELRPHLDALDHAYGHATEVLIDIHGELSVRTTRLRRQTRLLFLLRQLLDRYATGMTAQTLAAELVRFVGEACGGERCSLLLNDPDTIEDGLRVAAARGLPAEVNPDGVRVPSGAGISGIVARSGTPVVVRDPEDRARLPLVGDAAYTGDAFVSLPLIHRSRVLGVLNLTNFQEGTFDDTELEQMRLLAQCIALLVDHSRLSERIFAKMSA